MSPINKEGIEPIRNQAANVVSPSISMPVDLSAQPNTPSLEAHPVAAIVDAGSAQPPAAIEPLPPTEQSLDSYRVPDTPAPKGKLPGLSLVNSKLLTLVVLPLMVAGGSVLAFSLLSSEDRDLQSTIIADQSLLEALANPEGGLQNAEFNINLPTTVTGKKFIIQDASGNDLLVTDTANSRIGIGGFPEGEAKLQVLGDIMASGELLTNGGSTTLSDNGLRIGSVLVCTAAGCIAAPSSSPAPSTSSGTTTIIAPERPLDADTLQGSNAAFFLNATNISSGTLDDARLSVNITKAGNSFNGPLQLVMTNATGELPAISGINLTDVNATTLGGNNSSYYTNASNIASGTLADGRLSANVALRDATQTFTGYNTFRPAVDSVTSFQIQNAAANNILIADTSNNKIQFISASPSPGQVIMEVKPNLGRGTNANVVIYGTDGGGNRSAFYVQGGLAGNSFETGGTGGTANYSSKITTSASNTGLILQGAASQTADLLQLQNSSSTILGSFLADGSLRLGNQTYAATFQPLVGGTAGAINFGNGTGFNFDIKGNNSTLATFMDNGGNIQFNRGLNISGGQTGIFAQNGTSASGVLATLRLGVTATGDVLQMQNSSGTVMHSVSSGGAVLYRNTANSTTAFQIQNAAGTSDLFIADTTNSRIGIGATPANGLLTIGTNTIAASGGLYFGSDTNLYRSGVDTLRTDDNLFAAAQMRADSVQIGLSSANGLWSASGTLDLLAGSGIRFGSSSDTNLYRATADELRTDDRFHVQRAVNAAAFSSNIAGDGFSRWILNSGGVMSWGDGTATQDTNLYRGGADSLNTDDLFQVTRGLSTSPALAVLVSGDTVSRFAINADGKQEWGAGNAARDVSLYRSAANTLRTDDEFVVSGNPLTINGGFLQGIRASGTDDFLKVQLGAEGFYRFQADASGSLLWGSGAGVGDTNLYRSSANVLATDNNFRINGANVAFDHRGSTTTSQLTFRQRLSGDTNDRFSILSNGRMDWGPGNLAQDTNLYRSGAGTLMTDGALTIGTTLNAATLQQGGTGVLLTSSSSGGDLSGTFSNLQLAASVVTTTEIFDGTIMNADISASAAIGVSKLAAGSNGQVLGVVGGVVTWVDSGVPAGAVNFFNLASCPTGWSELTGARGRYLVGLPASGTLAGTNGTALTNLEDRAVGQHSHGVTGSPGMSDPGHSHPFSASVPTTTGGASTNLGGSPGVTTISGTNSSTTGITVNAGTLGTANTGSVAGTNAPYIQLLVCQKS